jgi:hypothetical protein
VCAVLFWKEEVIGIPHEVRGLADNLSDDSVVDKKEKIVKIPSACSHSFYVHKSINSNTGTLESVQERDPEVTYMKKMTVGSISQRALPGASVVSSVINIIPSPTIERVVLFLHR